MTLELVRRGYTEEQIEKLWSGNLLRVMDEVQRSRAVSCKNSSIESSPPPYRVQTRDVAIVFNTDQTGTNPRFIEFAQGANVLVMHFATAASDNPFHASPAVVGRVARDAGVKRLILSHIGQFDLEPALAELKKVYTGPLTIGAVHFGTVKKMVAAIGPSSASVQQMAGAMSRWRLTYQIV